MRNQIIYLLMLALIFLTFAILGSDTKSDSSDIESGPQALVPGIDYVQGEVIITMTPTHMPSKSEVSFSPPSLGIAELDSIFELYGGYKLKKLLPSYNTYISDSGRKLESTFILHYQNDIDAQDLAAILSQFLYIERAAVNHLLHIQFYGTKRLEPGGTTLFSLQWYFDNSYEGDMSDIDMPEAWAIEEGHPDTIIAIFDGGTMVDTCTNESGWKLHSDLNHHFNDAEDHGASGVLNGADLNGNDDDGDGYKDNTIGINLAKGCVNVPPLIECGEGNEAFWKAVPQNWELKKGYVPDSLQGELPCPDPVEWEPVGYDQFLRHGLGVASIAAGKLDGSDIVGVAHNCKVTFARIPCILAEDDLAYAIVNFSKFASVINCSWGTYDNPPLLLWAVNRATHKYGCVIVAATGNDHKDNKIGYPAAYDSVLAVGAITRGYGEVPVLTDYSNYNKNVEQVDVVAPVSYGVIMDSHEEECNGGCVSQQTYPCVISEDSLTYWGTSYAAPQAAGLAALIRSRFPNLNEYQVRQRIKNSAEYYWSDEGEDPYKYGKGKINAYRALTEWGEIKENTTWDPGDTRDSTYYISGDLTIKEGVTLTINEGTKIKIAPDHEQLGADPDRVQIIVDGTLQIGGEGADSVVFESFTDSPPTNQDWLGIKFQSGSSSVLENVVIKNCNIAVQVDDYDLEVENWGTNKTMYLNTSLSLTSDYTVNANNSLYILDSTNVVVQSGSDIDFLVKGSLICQGKGANRPHFRSTSEQRGDWFGVVFDSTSHDNIMHNAIIEHARVGIWNYAPLEIDGCSISVCTDGIKSFDSLWVKNTTISDANSYGIMLEKGVAVIDTVDISNCSIGINLQSTYQTSLTCRESHIHDIDLHGVSASSSNSSLTLQNTLPF